MLSSVEIGTLITAIGAGVGNADMTEDKIRYHKIVIMTDADVDGSHIRTLLLTFFFRHMRPIIEKGYLYIAQPPLFRAKRGQAETYLKDQKALDEYLVNAGLKEAVLSYEEGQISGQELREFVDIAIDLTRAIDQLMIQVSNRDVIEQAAILGMLNQDMIAHKQAGEYLAKRLDQQGDPLERGWQAETKYEEGPEDGHKEGHGEGKDTLVIGRTLRGIHESYDLSKKFIHTTEARFIDKHAALLQKIFCQKSQINHRRERTCDQRTIRPITAGNRIR